MQLIETSFSGTHVPRHHDLPLDKVDDLYAGGLRAGTVPVPWGARVGDAGGDRVVTAIEWVKDVVQAGPEHPRPEGFHHGRGAVLELQGAPRSVYDVDNQDRAERTRFR